MTEPTSAVLPEGWEMVIGLEVHCELHTATKLFCSCPNNFGDQPNVNTCPTCLGLPGSLPVLNEHAVELAMRLGRALACEVKRSVFARKNYFYPDQPKDYQVSQYDLPTNETGHLELPSGLRVGITRAHIEEDTGKLNHVGGGGRVHDARYSLVDYNRSGVPLVEIVSEADMRTSDQAKEYVAELRSILLATDVSDAKMEEGSMRVDANVSVNRGGEPWGTRCEIKNLNSLRSLGRAIDHEALRQIELLDAGERIRQETRHWDEAAGRTGTLRVKEDADDYRYFPEPDLVPLDPDEAWIERVRAALPILPAARRHRLAEATGSPVDAEPVMLVVERGHDEYVHAVIAAGGDPVRALVHVQQNLGDEDAVDRLPAADLAALTRLEVEGKVTATQARLVLADLIASDGGDAAAIASARGFEAMDTSAIDGAVDDAIAADPAAWAKYCAGEEKAAGALVGRIMKATKGKADGKAVTATLQARRAAAV